MPGKRWSPTLRDDLALAVARGATIGQWAQENDIPARTAREWSRKPEFKTAVADHRRSIIDRAIGKMVRRLVKAVDQVGRLADNAASEAVRLAAARSIVNDLLAVRRDIEIEERLMRIEQYLEEKGKRP
jgi:hypothetical protein